MFLNLCFVFDNILLEVFHQIVHPIIMGDEKNLDIKYISEMIWKQYILLVVGV